MEIGCGFLLKGVVAVVVVVSVYGMIALGEVRLPWRRGDNAGCGFLLKGVVCLFVCLFVCI